MLLIYLIVILTAVLKNQSSKSTFLKKELDCYYFNASSIRGKLQEFNSNFDRDDFDLIAIAETWLNDSVFDSEILINGGYNIFRKDRSKETSDKQDGGGVILAVNSNLNASRRHDLEEDKLEILWVQVHLDCKRSVYV